MKYSQEQLLIPTILVLGRENNPLNTTTIISRLQTLLEPQSEDLESYKGRKDSIFSQTVRNLLAPERSTDSLRRFIICNTNGKENLFSLTDDGRRIYNNISLFEISMDEGSPVQDSLLISSSAPTDFVWECIKIFNKNYDLQTLFQSDYFEYLERSYADYLSINGCYIAQEGDSQNFETIELYNQHKINRDFDARDISAFAKAVNDVFNGFYRVEIVQEGSSTIYKLIKILINDEYLPYITAIKTKPFLLLAGISGTGKSRIVRELARACWTPGTKEYKDPKPSNFEMVQVKPNWHDSAELIGYVSRVSGKSEYIAGPFLKFIAKAWEHIDTPYFLCLDEMNLAPVEQYFAEYLSVIESRKAKDGVVITDPIIDCVPEQWYFDLVGSLTENGKIQDEFKQNGITIPQNLIVVGTVNMDETTFSFSRKVLDRAMTIEMNDVDLSGGLEKRYEPVGLLSKRHLIGTFVEGVDIYRHHKSDCDMAIGYLESINKVLDNTPFKIAYRTRNEALLYVVNNLPYNLKSDGTEIAHNWLIAYALDGITNMKILSRIEGDETKVSMDFLTKLYDTIKSQLDEMGDCEFVPNLDEASEEENKFYSHSLAKLQEMKQRLSSGYTSFWS